MSVTWTLNGNSKYEVSSKEHLLQLMNQGTLYTDTGTPPADYWDGDYVQTVDINLDADANITPIGIQGDGFTGTYDGGNFSVSNWSYSGAAYPTGLFGRISGSTLENIKLTGVWVIDNSSGRSAFLVGETGSSSVRNIECVFDEGTSMTRENIADFGAVCGRTSFTQLYAATVKGFIHMATNTNVNSSIGGVVGDCAGSHGIGLRNAAVWTNGITGGLVGGIAGEVNGNLSHAVNAMVGDITGKVCGGVYGYSGNAGSMSQLVNSMKGNITGTDYAGGIMGHGYCNYGSFVATDTTNYMTGNIVSTNNTSGGIVGCVTRKDITTHSASIYNSINAMNGNVDEAAIGVSSIVNSVSVKIDTAFGLTYSSATHGSVSDTFTGTTSTLIPELSYIPMTFTDNASNSYEYEPVFGNIGGNASYSQYTHAVISKDDIAGPYFIDFDLASNTTEYLTYMDVDSNSAFTDATLIILDSSAQTVYDYAGNTIYPLVQWVLDSNSKYEISSKHHLISLMNSGAVFANTGSVPTDYMDSDYIQTVDIDLEGDSTNIKPLGPSPGGDAFSGEYDGNGFTVSNWVYVDPNYPNSASSGSTRENERTGFFGDINSGTVKNVRLAGVCSITGFSQMAGIFAGMIGGYSMVSNIEVDLSPGSFILQGNSETISRIGGMVGQIGVNSTNNGTVTGMTLRGQMDSMTPSTGSSIQHTGGIVGYMRFSTGVVSLFRNLCSFPGGINGTRAGGIVGGMEYSSLTKVINAMTGDISEKGEGYAGGVAGEVAQTAATHESYEYINAMKGNITAESMNSYSGGVVGLLSQNASATVYSFMNYMGGTITNSFIAARTGGIIGRASGANLLTSINAMNGIVHDSSFGLGNLGALITIDKSFGLVSNSDKHETPDPVVGLPTDPENGLPVVDLTVTDFEGTVLTFDFVFGNGPRSFNQLQIKAGNDYFNMSELEIVTMEGENIALLGTASVTSTQNTNQASLGIDGNTDPNYSSGTVMDLYYGGGPTWTLDLDREITLPEINKVVFYNRQDASQEELRAVGSIITLHSSDSIGPLEIAVLTGDIVQEFIITAVPNFLVPVARISTVDITVLEFDGATSYRVNIQEDGTTDVRVTHNNIPTGDYVIRGLKPNTTYTINLLAKNGGVFELAETDTITTQENSASSYDRNNYAKNGIFDLTTLDTSEFELMNDVINDVFDSGEKLDITVGGRGSRVVFVKRGEAVSTDDSILVPFNSSAGSGQAITMNLSDSSTVSVAYDEVSNSLDVGGSAVEVGESIVVDGKKLTVQDI